MTSRRCEVWGAPISHSKSPALHTAAYRSLGLDWEYRSHHVDAAHLGDHFQTTAGEVSGLSLTMPLKEAILELVADHRGPVDLLHAANTAVRGESGRWWLDNTDWWGSWQTLNDHGGVRSQRIWLLGAGATARAVLYGLAQDTPESVTLFVRSPERAQVTRVLAQTLGLNVSVCLFGQLPADQPDWVISTLPGGAQRDTSWLSGVTEASHLFDIAYDPWPSPLARLWQGQATQTVSGLTMLAYQALAQVRAFVLGEVDTPLPNESLVKAAMWQAVGLDAGPQPSVKQ